MRLLLTGGSGFIATHTIVSLHQAGHSFIVADNFINSSPKAITQTECIIKEKIKVYQIDVCDAKALQRIFSENHIDAVIHFAGLKAVGESVYKPLEYFRNNIDSTLTLLETMRSFRVKKMIFSSSATVYGTPDALPLSEDMPCKPCINPYGWTKYTIERILESVYTSDNEWSIMILRYFNPVGAHESGLIGDNPSSKPNNIMPILINAALGKTAGFHVFGNDYQTHDGTCVRDYIHVMDLARGHTNACEYTANCTGLEIVNLGTGIGHSVLELFNTFNQANALAIPYTITSRRPGDTDASYADPQKARNLLGWQAEKSLEDMCKDAWKFAKNNPNGYA